MPMGDRARRALAHYGSRLAGSFRSGDPMGSAAPADVLTVPARADLLLADLRRAWPPDRRDPRGGFLVQPRADDVGPTPPWGTIPQARVTWFHAALAVAGFGTEHLDAAAHGLRHLRERHWDDDHGGFWWQVDPEGDDDDRSKHVYAQAFGLFAVAQCSRAGCDGAAAFADEIFGVIDERWGLRVPQGRPDAYDATWTTTTTTRQSLDAVLHLLEAVTVLAQVTSRPVVHDSLAHLVDLVGERLVRYPCGTCADAYGPGWSTMPPTRHTVSYGHECERISFVLRAVDVLGADPAPWVDRFTALTAHLADVGVDRRRGGFWSSGPPCRPAWHRQKVWWVQAEALYALSSLHRLRPLPSTAALLDQTLRWVEDHHHDPVTGDWHAELVGVRVLPKPIAGPWKASYHTGRVLLALTDRLG